jgi:hypothetical protein
LRSAADDVIDLAPLFRTFEIIKFRIRSHRYRIKRSRGAGVDLGFVHTNVAVGLDSELQHARDRDN